MNSLSTKLFTGGQIGRAAGLTRQAVNDRLTKNQGAAVDAWPFESLPMEWQQEITRRGVKRGFENGENFLASLPAAPWKCPLPWDRVPAKEQAKAVRLQKALAPAFELHARGAAAGDVTRTGLDDFKAEFGYVISRRHWRQLLARTIERDAGEENWLRLEIYLDERAFAPLSPKREVFLNEYQHRALDDVFSVMENRQDPTATDREFLWDAVFRHYEQHTDTLIDSPAGNTERRQFKNSLLGFLFRAFPEKTLCATLPSLKRRFDEKLAQWRAGGRIPAALQDRRALDSGNFRKASFPEDLKKIRNLAIQLDGNESLAHRMLRGRGELSKEFCEAHPYDPRRNKSALPESVRDSITPEVDMCLPIRRGPWQARMRGPYIPRDWSKEKPGDFFSADDVTWNHYFKEQLSDGRWTVLRGECLLMTDLRTGYPLDFLLIPGKYNGEHVRSLALRVHDQVGLPRCGFYFERGVWASRLVTGDSRHGTPVSWREAENGLCSSGLKLEVRHAHTPRAKPIEGLIRILQDRMRCIFGFVGFNERQYDAERIQPLIARAQRGDPAALEQFPTAREWADKIGAVLNEFAHEPQNGKMLEGASPAEAWGAELTAQPLRKLAEEARYILSTHQKKVTVRQEGILLTIRGKSRLYYNGNTGPIIGSEVLAFYNIEMPELLTVCDMTRQNYFSVRSVELPAMSATPEQLAEVNQLRKAHMAHAKGIFGQLKHEVVSTITRDTEHTEEEKDFGRFHNEEVAKVRAEQGATSRKLRKIRTEAAAAGIAVGANVRNPDRVLTGVERAKLYRERIAQEESEKQNTRQ